MIQLSKIKKSYQQLTILHEIDLAIEKGNITSIVGSSGAGKSTLLHIMGTLLQPDSGRIVLDGQNISSFTGDQLADFRNKNIGFIFQFHHLLPEFTAIENVLIPAMIAGNLTSVHQKRAKELLDYLKVGHRKEHKPSEMSGGEQQRVAVARALMNAPKIILADEPSGNLDTKNAEELHQLFFNLKNEMNLTFVIVTHNEKLARMSDRIITMSDGRIIQDTLKAN
jgi:lipoprotein-releasing system ATP-binding protein